MANTVKRPDSKRYLIRLLRKQGYATYAKLLEKFDVYLTDDPSVIGYMVPGQAMIVLNKKLSARQVSVIVRHEILHEYLTHHDRKTAFHQNNPNYRDDQQLANIAADFEISNRAYTDDDKRQIRAILIDDEILSGLVTEIQKPGWENLTFEEMYRKLLDERQEMEDDLKDLLDMIDKLNKKLSPGEDGAPQAGKGAQQAIDNARDEAEKSDSGGGEGEGEGQGEDGGDTTGNKPGDSKTSSSRGSSTDGSNSDDGNTDPTSGKGIDVKKELDQLEKEVDSAMSELSGIKKKADAVDTGNEDGTFMSDSDQQYIAELSKRAQEIDDLFRDATVRARIIEESEKPVKRERADKAAKAELEYRKNPLRQFRLSLNRFITDQLGIVRDETWTKLNPSYEDSEFLIPGIARQEKQVIPLINVYHDISGSFDTEEKTAAAMSAIASLNEYVRKGKIKIDLYFFAENCSKSKSDVKTWGTNGRPIQENIAQTKPTNVIIITDSDISDCVDETVVPGAVWLLFYDGESENLIQHIRGKKQTRTYLITGKDR